MNTADVADRILERQRTAPQYDERVAAVRAVLNERGVSPEIIDRVLRVSEHLREGDVLRGIHYTTERDKEPVWMRGYVRKGEFLRRFGRAHWDALPRQAIMKRGRREYVAREVAQDIAKVPGAA